MEAWILKIDLEWYDDGLQGVTGKLHRDHQYSVWASEKIAQAECKDMLLKHPNWFTWQDPLKGAIKCLLDDNHIEEAIALINEYSKAIEVAVIGGSYYVHIDIIQSQFKGSVFE